MREICERVLIPAKTIVDFQTFGNPNSEKLILVLHGYGQNSSTIKEDLVEHLDEKYYYIIPNGVFPMPKQRTNEISYRYAWYFYNTIDQKYYIDFNYPSEVLSNFLSYINPTSKPVTIIGYSQGGYLAPFLAQSYCATDKVIGINCNFRHDMLGESLNFDLYAIHGDRDEIVDYNKSKNSYEKLSNRFNKGSFITVKQATHAIDNKVVKAVASLI